MNDLLLADVLRHIEEFNFVLDKGTGWLRKGKCPHCGKKELFTHGDHPWVLKCGRLSKCGWEGHVKDLYPELFQDWSKRAAQQPDAEANPNAAADLYMQAARGFDLDRVRGWYEQQHYTDHKADQGRGASTATVRFTFGPTWWQRLIDRPGRFEGKKATFRYQTPWAGHWWQPPTLDLAKVTKLWLTEGIFNAIALDHHGIAAVSAMSSANYPHIALAALREAHAKAGTTCTLVWALDGDTAGRRATAKHVERARLEGWECEAAQVPQTGKTKRDWNDLHQLGRLEPQHLTEYLYHGALLIAESASAKALLMYRHSGGKRTAFAFDHNNRLYWFKLDLEAFNRAVQQLEKEGRHDNDEELREEALKAAHIVQPIANCLPRPLYFQANLLTDESWYYFRIDFPHDGAPIKNTFSASAIASSSEFKKRLLAVAPGGMFTGNGTQLDRYIEDGLYQIQRVETIDFIGYCREQGAYLFNTLAVRQGELVEINGDDFFDFGKLSLKSLNQSVHLAINADEAEYSAQWLQLLWECFGAKGLAALAFWFGTLFAEQIRGKHKSWPFLEVVGEAGAGKSTLIEFLWKLLGRGDYEGFDPSKSSLAARARNFAQVANLPVVLIESDREKLGGEKGPHVKSFDWDELKTAFNGRSVRARGMATGGNETYEPPFRGAIVISQNNAVQASEPILQRICHLTFDRSAQTPATREAAIALEQMPLASVSGWILRAVRAERRVLELLDARVPELEQELLAQPGVKSTRIAKNHAQLAAAAEALALVTPLTKDMQRAVREQVFAMAAERQAAINMDHPIVSEFWETFDYLDGAGFPLNHARDPQHYIAVSLPHFLQGCRERGQAAPLLADLKKLLPTSKRHKFVEAKVVNSVIRDDTRNADKSPSVFCWVFERKAHRK